MVLPFWYRPTRVVLDKGPLNGRVCIVVVVFVSDAITTLIHVTGQVGGKIYTCIGSASCVPAVYDEAAGVIGSRHELDSAHEQQQRCGVLWDAVVRPRRELEMMDFARFAGPLL